MTRNILGIDIGYDSLKLALCNNGRVKKAVTVPMPVNLIKDNRITSQEAMTDLLRTTMRKAHIRARQAAFILPNELSYVRTITMPAMNAEQLAYNLPYEFNDYITDELKNYIFDYAMLSDPKAHPGEPMELMGVAVPATAIQDVRTIFSKAGLKLVKAAPAECAYISLIRAAKHDSDREYCILDLGYRAIRMFMYRGDRHVVTRVLEVGLHNLDDVIAESMNVDTHLAHTYLLTNYEDCQDQDFCINAYNNVAVELMRALNFYRFSNRDSELNDVWVCGGGVAIPGLCNAIHETLGMEMHSVEELLPPGVGQRVEDPVDYTLAIGITLER